MIVQHGGEGTANKTKSCPGDAYVLRGESGRKHTNTWTATRDGGNAVHGRATGRRACACVCVCSWERCLFF